MVKLMKKYKGVFFGSIILLTLLFFTILLVRTNISVTYTLIKQDFQKMSISKDDDNYSNMMMRLTDRVNYFYDKVSLDSLELNDLEISSLFGKKKSKIKINSINLRFINILRMILGEPRLESENLIKFYSTYSKGYITEESGQYKNAISIYKTAVSETSDTTLVNLVKLHIAFCYTMLGDFNTSSKIFSMINSEDQVGKTASFLLSYVDTLKKEKSKIIESKKSYSINSAKKLTKLMNYKVALNLFKKMDSSATSKIEKGELAYYKGICYNKIGNKKKAINSFVQALENSNQNMKKKANRRIFFASYKIKDGKKLRKTTIRIAKKLKDNKIGALKEKLDEKKIENKNFIVKPSRELLVKDSSSSVAKKSSHESQDSSFVDTGFIKINNSYFEKKLDSVANKIVEKKEKIRDTTIVVKQKIIPKRDIFRNRRIVIVTKDNKVFFGTLINSSKSSILQLKSIIGIVGIRKKDIKSIELSK